MSDEFDYIDWGELEDRPSDHVRDPESLAIFLSSQSSALTRPLPISEKIRSF